MQRLNARGRNAKRQVLVVEDDDINRGILSELLKDEFEVLEARDGEEGFAQLEAHYDDLSLILLDVYMPVCDGFEFLRRKAADSRFESVPVIVTTASDSVDDEIRCLKLGANDFVVKPYNFEIITNRANNMIRLRESASIVNRLTWDETTGLYSKEFFYHAVDDALLAAPESEFDLVCSDIENFKLLNDRYGEERCDDLLAELAEKLEAAFANPVASGRIGPDVFAFLIKDPHRDWNEMLEPALQNLSLGHVSVKFGIMEHMDHDLPTYARCNRALSALETVKGRHDVLYAVFDEELHRRQELEQTIRESMQEAIEESQFSVFFQPKHNVHTNRVGGAEALVRWFHPIIGFINPGLFVPIFERNGFITNLDLFVWEEACKEVARCKEVGLPMVPISTNVSRLDFDLPDLPQRFAAIADKHGVPHQCLHVEITETAYTDNPQLVVKTLQEFQALGFATELDDFGAGYSSLISLNTLPLSIMKLDMSMIRAATELNDFRIVESAIRLAQMLDLESVVEGVETEEEAQRVTEIGCDMIQGYFFSKPLNRDDFEVYLKQDSQRIKTREEGKA